MIRRQGRRLRAPGVVLGQIDDVMQERRDHQHLPINARRHLGRDLLHLAFTARGPKSDFHRKGWPRLMTSLPAVLRPGRGAGFYNFDTAPQRYILHDALWTMRKTLGR